MGDVNAWAAVAESGGEEDAGRLPNVRSESPSLLLLPPLPLFLPRVYASAASAALAAADLESIRLRVVCIAVKRGMGANGGNDQCSVDFDAIDTNLVLTSDVSFRVRIMRMKF